MPWMPLDQSFPVGACGHFYDSAFKDSRIARAAQINGRGDLPGTAHVTVTTNSRLDVEMQGRKAFEVRRNVEVRKSYPETYQRPFIVVSESVHDAVTGKAAQSKPTVLPKPPAADPVDDLVETTQHHPAPKIDNDEEIALGLVQEKIESPEPEPAPSQRLQTMRNLAKATFVSRAVDEIVGNGLKVEVTEAGISAKTKAGQVVAVLDFDETPTAGGAPAGASVRAYTDARKADMQTVIDGCNQNPGASPKSVTQAVAVFRKIAMMAAAATDPKSAARMTKAALAVK